jgi:hypothetical protein
MAEAKKEKVEKGRMDVGMRGREKMERKVLKCQWGMAIMDKQLKK